MDPEDFFEAAFFLWAPISVIIIVLICDFFNWPFNIGII